MLSRPYTILQSPSTPSPHLPLIPPFISPSIPRVGTGSDSVHKLPYALHFNVPSTLHHSHISPHPPQLLLVIPLEFSWLCHIGIQLFYSLTHILSHRLIHFTPLHISTPQSPSFQAPPCPLLAPHVLSGHIPPLIIQFHSSLHIPMTSFNSQVPPDLHPSQFTTLWPSGITPLTSTHLFTF